MEVGPRTWLRTGARALCQKRERHEPHVTSLRSDHDRRDVVRMSSGRGVTETCRLDAGRRRNVGQDLFTMDAGARDRVVSKRRPADG